MKRINTRIEALEKTVEMLAIEKSTRNAVKELEDWHKNMVMKYNSTSEREKRHRQYKELQETSKQRKQAFDRGDSMSKYPLPWEKSL